MYRYKRLAIVLNLTDSDTTLVRYADKVSRMAKSEKAYFVHVIDHSEIPESIRKEHPEIHQIPGELLEDKIKNLVRKNFVSQPNIDVFYETPKMGFEAGRCYGCCRQRCWIGELFTFSGSGG